MSAMLSLLKFLSSRMHCFLPRGVLILLTDTRQLCGLWSMTADLVMNNEKRTHQVM